MPEDPAEPIIDLGSPPEDDALGGGLQITGLRTVGGMSDHATRFSGLFNVSDEDDSSSEEGMAGFDEDDAGRDLTVGNPGGDYEENDGVDGVGRKREQKDRRPSTTEAKQRTPLDDDEDDEDPADIGRAIDAKMVLRGEGPIADPAEESSDDEELVEIRPRRTS